MYNLQQKRTKNVATCMWHYWKQLQYVECWMWMENFSCSMKRITFKDVFDYDCCDDWSWIKSTTLTMRVCIIFDIFSNK